MLGIPVEMVQLFGIFYWNRDIVLCTTITTAC